MGLLEILEQKSYIVKELSLEAYNELLVIFNFRNTNDLLYCEEQLLEQGLELQYIKEEIYCDSEEHSVFHHLFYLLDNKNMVKYIVNDYFE